MKKIEFLDIFLHCSVISGFSRNLPAVTEDVLSATAGDAEPILHDKILSGLFLYTEVLPVCFYRVVAGKHGF